MQGGLPSSIVVCQDVTDIVRLKEAVERAATLADKACRTQQVDQVGHLIADVVEELHHLREAVAPSLAAHEARDARSEEEASPEDMPLDPAALAALLASLLRNDLSALDQLQAVAAGLRPRLGDDGLAHLREQVDNLAFAEAAAVLQSLLASEAVA